MQVTTVPLLLAVGFALVPLFLDQDALEKCFYLRWVSTVYELALVGH